MANVDRRWIAPAIIAAAFAASAMAYTRLPSAVAPQMTELLPFRVPDTNESGPRWMAAFLIPSIAAVLWLGFRFAATARAQRLGRWFFRNAPAEATSAGQFERFAKTYETVVIGVVSLTLALHSGFLAAAFQRPTMAARIIGVTLALFLIAVGNVMPRLRANWVAGVRTSATLADPDLWRTTHRAFGAALVGAGVVTLVIALAAPRYSLLIGLALLVLSCVVAFVTTRGRRGTMSTTLAAGLAIVLGPTMGDGQSMAAHSPAAAVAPSTVMEEGATLERDGLVLRGTLALPPALGIFCVPDHHQSGVPNAARVRRTRSASRGEQSRLMNTKAHALIFRAIPIRFPNS
jgi:hypothetical protein